MGWLVQGYLDLTLRSFFAYIISTLSPLSVAWIWRWSSKFFLLLDSSHNAGGAARKLSSRKESCFGPTERTELMIKMRQAGGGAGGVLLSWQVKVRPNTGNYCATLTHNNGPASSLIIKYYTIFLASPTTSVNILHILLTLWWIISYWERELLVFAGGRLPIADWHNVSLLQARKYQWQLTWVRRGRRIHVIQERSKENVIIWQPAARLS